MSGESSTRSDLFTAFVNLSKQNQDAFISGCLHLEMVVPPPNNSRSSDDVKKQRNFCKYELSSNQGRYQVCCAFFLSVLHVKHKIFRVIQDKFEHCVLNFIENRGKHNNRL